MMETGKDTYPLLPGPRKICLPVSEKNSAKSKKIQHFFKTSIFKHLIGIKNVKGPLQEFHLGENCKENLSQKLRFVRKNACFSSNIFFGRFSAAFGKKRRPYGRQFFSANRLFLGPVLSYFAEFSAGWQQRTYPAHLQMYFLKP
jgi:hypothetical protein